MFISQRNSIAAIAVSWLVVITVAAPSHAGGLSADARCQKALAIGTRKITAAVLKGAERCHRSRMRANVAAAIDCNDPGQFTGKSLQRLQSAVAKLDGGATRHCDAAAAPGSLGYDPCPAPCGAVTIGNYTDVASCLSCIAQSDARAVARALFGAPAPPGSRTNETKCHAALTRAVRKYAQKRMQTQWQCKTAQERGGLAGVNCRDVDYKSKISRALEKLQSKLSTDEACPEASIVALDLCPSASGETHFIDATPVVDLLHSCVEDVANERTNDLYDRVYAPGGASPSILSAPSTIASAWADSGGQGLDERNPRFRLNVGSTSTVTLDLTSTAADAYLYLVSSDGSVVLAEDDNGGGGTNSRISIALDVGRYLLVAATASAGAVGNFTVSTDTGSIEGCFLAYGGLTYTGSSTLFCDGGTGALLTDDSYSSLRVPKGVFVRTYENADRSGRAHTYYGDTPSLQPFLDNVVSSIEWGVFDSEDFFMISVSDSQITWGYCSDNGASSLCAQEQSFFGPGATEEEVAFYYNTNLTNALNQIKDSIGMTSFGGVIVNGDLTEFGKQGSDLADYIDIYDLGVAANVYPGLGNHDYANNVDDCFTNFCASAMVDYFAKQVSSLNAIDFDYSVQQTQQPGPPPVRFDYTGSLGYSFEIGDVHFVQLNNYPTYTRLWQRLLPNTEHWYDIQSSITWLRNDLQNAVAGGKEIIANLHDWGGANVSAFHDVLDDFPVSAVYAGHYHSIFGRYTESGPYTDGKPIPVFLSGSAHYGTMLVTRFTGGKLYVWVLRVDQFNGATLQVRQSGTFQDVTDLSTLFDICPACTTTYEYVYDFR